MKILLLKDVKGLGRKNEVREANQGHALNFLIPKGFAKAVTGNQAKSIKVAQERQKEQHEVHDHLILQTLESIKGKEVVLKETANEKGHLFRKVQVAEIIQAIKENLKVEIRPEWISDFEVIKEVGNFDLFLEYGNQKFKLKVLVESK